MSLSLWQQCLARLQEELTSQRIQVCGFAHCRRKLSDNTLALYAPNRFVLDWVRINTLITSMDC
ncbi:DnaA N-terminal domain-containing protein [Shigella flexneri]